MWERHAIGTLTGSLENFDKVNNVPAESGAHSTKSSEKDLYHKVIKQLAKSRVFNVTPGRGHKNSFANLETNYIRSLSLKKEWMLDHYASVRLESKD